MHRIPSLLALAVAILSASALAQEKSVAPEINKPYEKAKIEDCVKRFEGEGREIAMQRRQIVAACELKPGMAVADVGAGTGLFTRMFADEVGASGTVYAVDITKSFLEHIEKTCREAKLGNVKAVLCTPTSSELPPQSVDLAFLSDVYHHLEFPEKTMASVHRALRPGGRLVIIDFVRIEGKSPEGILKHVRAGEETVVREVEAAGFRRLDPPKNPPKLKENYFVQFEKSK